MPWRSSLAFVVPLLASLSPLDAHAEADQRDTSLYLHGDIVGGYYADQALYATAGRETQIFKFTRAIIGVEAEHASGVGGLLEYNFVNDEVRHEPGNRAYVDWYKNLGSDLLYYGDSNVRNAYVRFRESNKRHTLRAGRMVNIIGFEDEQLPYTGRLDAPHMRYLDKEILNGVAYAYDRGPFFLELAVLNGAGRPDFDYNWYLKGQTDPNIKGNNTPIVEGKLELGGERFALSASYHTTKNGSAPGSLYSGKHNDTRSLVGLRASTGRIGFVRNIELIGQAARYLVGLTEEGSQGLATPLWSEDLKKDGWFATLGFTISRLSIYYTREELDRIDSLVWDKVAHFDPSHPAFDSVETSDILAVKYRFNDITSLTLFYRALDFDYSTISDIPAADFENHGVDKYGAVLQVRF
jgi:hypothetical protein